LLDPKIMVPPLLWLVSPDSEGMTGKRLVATRWPPDRSGREAAEAAIDQAGWPN
jgi:3-oxoacyl-[acyl-carrier protein] reductase